MQSKIIRYVGFYDTPTKNSKRVSNLAAINKMNYVASAVKRLGYQVEIVSPSWINGNTGKKYEKQKTINLEDNICVTLCPSWITNNKVTRMIKIIFSLLWLFLYLLLKVKKGEKIIAYHVQWISLPVRLAKFLKGFKLVLEVEEIYGEVWDTSNMLYSMEKKLINSADSYIFVSDVLKEHINSKRKKSAILYGGYPLIKLNERKQKGCQCSTVNLVYAGSIDSVKGGAFKAVEVMKYLPKNYKLYILGHGSLNHIKKLKKVVKDTNLQRNKKVCEYIGTLHDEEYSNFLLKCDLALNTQNEGDYMNTAFPSKILSYLSHNLRVVSTPIKSILHSSLAELIYFSKNDEPESFGKVIKGIDLTKEYNSTKEIEKLDQEFIKKLTALLEG